MTGPYEAVHELTAEQRAVIATSAATPLLVTAGAGAGKTHTLVRRLHHLLVDEEIAARDILVLSFSRASVRELRTRLLAAGEAGRMVQVRTFDSWALEILAHADGVDEWLGKSFDERIRAAADRIRDEAADGLLDEIRHVVIDEAQDLVGDRLRMVSELFERFDCSCTVVGDTAQSIYGFQIEAPLERAASADAFFRYLRERFGEELVELRLEQNFRARTAEAMMALHHGPQLRSTVGAAASEGGHFKGLRDTLRKSMLYGELDDPVLCAELGREQASVAILCRANSQVLLASEKLRAAGVEHRVQRLAGDRVAPSWLTQLFARNVGPTLAEGRFRDITDELGLPGHTSADLVWNRLMRVAGTTSGRAIELGRLRQLLAQKRLPDELTAQPPAPVLLSTFHRAKGLEFDKVIVMDPGPLHADSATPEAEEARLLYVAMTRSRDELMHLEPLRDRRVGKDRSSNRYARFGGNKGWHRFGMELLGDDVHGDDPAGTYGTSTDPHAAQQRLATSVRPGDPVELERLTELSDENGLSPSYVILHEGEPIGVTSREFRRAMWKLRGGRGGRKPYEPSSYAARLTSVHVDAVQAVAGSTASGERAGFDARGVWLAPRLVGLSRFELGGGGRDA